MITSDAESLSPAMMNHYQVSQHLDNIFEFMKYVHVVKRSILLVSRGLASSNCFASTNLELFVHI